MTAMQQKNFDFFKNFKAVFPLNKLGNFKKLSYLEN